MKKITWSDLPKEIQEKMLEHQSEQGNERDEKVFEDMLSQDSNRKGFNWCRSIEKHDFWSAIITNGEIERFYTLYPKQK